MTLRPYRWAPLLLAALVAGVGSQVGDHGLAATLLGLAPIAVLPLLLGWGQNGNDPLGAAIRWIRRRRRTVARRLLAALAPALPALVPAAPTRHTRSTRGPPA